MSDIQSRPVRGRTTTRGGGRGGLGSRGPRSSKQANGDLSSVDTSANEGELGELKRRYQSQLSTLKEVFPDWTDADLVLAIEESDGDLSATIEKISEGNVSQFAEVKKTKDRARSKVKEAPAPADAASSQRGIRGDRRGGDSVRGGRSRGTDRGRGGFRGGARGGATNGARTGGGATSVSTADAWGISEGKDNDQSAAAAPAEPEVPKAAPAPAAPPKKTWASMFATPKPAPAPPKPAAQPAPPKEQPVPVPAETAAHDVAQEAAVEAEELPIPPVADEIPAEPPVTTEQPPVATPEKPADEPVPEVELTPSKDELTKDNVEHLPDESHPPPTETAASTVASSRDIGVATPLSTSQAPIGRPAIGGFATTALKATGTPHRSASYQRRLLEQQEAVVLPGNHAVDRAAVQFGSLGLNGEADADNLDVDEDREDAETRTQPPQHSPVAQPRAALPPAPRQGPSASDSQPQDSIATPKQAPGLPPVPQQQPISQQSPSEPLGAQPVQNQGPQGNYNQFGRYGQSGIQADASAPPQKPYDPFGQQAPQSQYDYNQQQSQQSQPQSQAGGFSSAPDSFGSQYLTAEQRSAYQNYYGGYGQQSTPSQQEAGSAQQRTNSAFGADSSFPGSQQQTQGRYNDAQNSGHTTPNPAAGNQHPSGPASQGQHMPQQHQPGQHTGGYPYNNHPIYNTPQYAAWMSQFGGMYGQGGYGGFGNKGMYGQPHHYGMSPQASYDNQHSSSPANAGGFGATSVQGRESGLGGGLGEFGRSASGTSQNQHGATAGGYGGFPDVLGRSQAGYPNQSSSYGQQQVGQQASTEDSLKPFGEPKATGPSPSALGAQQGRPGSSTNNTPSQGGQGGLPGQQQGFGGYPSHLGHQYGGLGGLGHQGAGSHQGGGYGGNYGNFSGYGNYGSYGRGGWGGNYGGQH